MFPHLILYIVDHKEHLQELEVEIEGTLAGKVLDVNLSTKKLSFGIGPTILSITPLFCFLPVLDFLALPANSQSD